MSSEGEDSSLRQRHVQSLHKSAQLIEKQIDQVVAEHLKLAAEEVDDMTAMIKTKVAATDEQKAKDMATHLSELRDRIKSDITELGDRRKRMYITQLRAAQTDAEVEALVQHSTKSLDQEVQSMMDARVAQMMQDMNGGLLSYDQTVKLLNIVGPLAFIVILATLIYLAYLIVQ